MNYEEDFKNFLSAIGEEPKYYRGSREYKYYYYVHVPVDVTALFLSNSFEIYADTKYPPIPGFQLLRYTSTYAISCLQFAKRIHKFYIGHLNIPVQHVNNKRWNGKQ